MTRFRDGLDDMPILGYGAKNARRSSLFAPFIYKNENYNASFYQDRLGTNIGKTQKRVAFFAGRASLAHDRLYSFHNTLAGHSLNYISRGTYWGTEQRQQLDYAVGNGTGAESTPRF
jgi:hypothetical protein